MWKTSVFVDCRLVVRHQSLPSRMAASCSPHFTGLLLTSFCPWPMAPKLYAKTGWWLVWHAKSPPVGQVMFWGFLQPSRHRLRRSTPMGRACPDAAATEMRFPLRMGVLPHARIHFVLRPYLWMRTGLLGWLVDSLAVGVSFISAGGFLLG